MMYIKMKTTRVALMAAMAIATGCTPRYYDNAYPEGYYGPSGSHTAWNAPGSWASPSAPAPGSTVGSVDGAVIELSLDGTAQSTFDVMDGEFRKLGTANVSKLAKLTLPSGHQGVFWGVSETDNPANLGQVYQALITEKGWNNGGMRFYFTYSGQLRAIKNEVSGYYLVFEYGDIFKNKSVGNFGYFVRLYNAKKEEIGVYNYTLPIKSLSTGQHGFDYIYLPQNGYSFGYKTAGLTQMAQPYSRDGVREKFLHTARELNTLAPLFLTAMRSDHSRNERAIATSEAEKALDEFVGAYFTLTDDLQQVVKTLQNPAQADGDRPKDQLVLYVPPTAALVENVQGQKVYRHLGLWRNNGFSATYFGLRPEGKPASVTQIALSNQDGQIALNVSLSPEGRPKVLKSTSGDYVLQFSPQAPDVVHLFDKEDTYQRSFRLDMSRTECKDAACSPTWDLIMAALHSYHEYLQEQADFGPRALTSKLSDEAKRYAQLLETLSANFADLTRGQQLALSDKVEASVCGEFEGDSCKITAPALDSLESKNQYVSTSAWQDARLVLPPTLHHDTLALTRKSASAAVALVPPVVVPVNPGADRSSLDSHNVEFAIQSLVEGPQDPPPGEVDIKSPKTFFIPQYKHPTYNPYYPVYRDVQGECEYVSITMAVRGLKAAPEGLDGPENSYELIKVIRKAVSGSEQYPGIGVRRNRENLKRFGIYIRWLDNYEALIKAAESPETLVGVSLAPGASYAKQFNYTEDNHMSLLTGVKGTFAFLSDPNWPRPIIIGTNQLKVAVEAEFKRTVAQGYTPTVGYVFYKGSAED